MKAYPRFPAKSRSNRSQVSNSGRAYSSRVSQGLRSPASAKRGPKGFARGARAGNFGQRRPTYGGLSASRNARPAKKGPASQAVAGVYPLRSLKKTRMRGIDERGPANAEARARVQKLKQKWISPRGAKAPGAQRRAARRVTPKGKRPWTSFGSRPKGSSKRSHTKFSKKQASVPQRKANPSRFHSRKKPPFGSALASGSSRLKAAQRRLGKTGLGREVQASRVRKNGLRGYRLQQLSRRTQAEKRRAQMAKAKRLGRAKAATTSAQRKTRRTGLSSRGGAKTRRPEPGLQTPGRSRALKKSSSTFRGLGVLRTPGKFASIRKGTRNGARKGRAKLTQSDGNRATVARGTRPRSEFAAKAPRSGRSTRKQKAPAKRIAFKSAKTKEKQVRREQRLKEEMRKLNEQNRIRKLRAEKGLRKAAALGRARMARARQTKNRTTPLSKLKTFRESLHKRMPLGADSGVKARPKRLFSNPKGGCERKRLDEKLRSLKLQDTDREVESALRHVQGTLEGIDSIRRSGLREKTTRSLSKRLKRFFDKEWIAQALNRKKEDLRGRGAKGGSSKEEVQLSEVVLKSREGNLVKGNSEMRPEPEQLTLERKSSSLESKKESEKKAKTVKIESKDEDLSRPGTGKQAGENTDVGGNSLKETEGQKEETSVLMAKDSEPEARQKGPNPDNFSKIAVLGDSYMSLAIRKKKLKMLGSLHKGRSRELRRNQSLVETLGPSLNELTEPQKLTGTLRSQHLPTEGWGMGMPGSKRSTNLPLRAKHCFTKGKPAKNAKSVDECASRGEQGILDAVERRKAAQLSMSESSLRKYRTGVELGLKERALLKLGLPTKQIQSHRDYRKRLASTKGRKLQTLVGLEKEAKCPLGAESKRRMGGARGPSPGRQLSTEENIIRNQETPRELNSATNVKAVEEISKKICESIVELEGALEVTGTLRETVAGGIDLRVSAKTGPEELVQSRKELQNVYHSIGKIKAFVKNSSVSELQQTDSGLGERTLGETEPPQQKYQSEQGRLTSDEPDPQNGQGTEAQSAPQEKVARTKGA